MVIWPHLFQLEDAFRRWLSELPEGPSWQP